MIEKVILPKQGLQMTEGIVTKWLIREGELCEKGKPLFEMETDKVTITIDAPASGTLLKILRGEGDTVPITEVIAYIGDQDDIIPNDTIPSSNKMIPENPIAISNDISMKNDQRAFTRAMATPRALSLADKKNIPIENIPPSGPNGLVIEQDVNDYAISIQRKASPLAKKIANLEDVDISEISGSGSHGKIMAGDVRQVANNSRLKRNDEQRSYIVPMTSMRKVIAERMTASLHTHAQLCHSISVDMTNSMHLREICKKNDRNISYNDIILMSVSRALQKYPILNASIVEKGILMHNYVNLGIAIAIDKGLIVPNVKDIDQMNLEEISIRSKELAEKARKGQLTQEDCTGGTFTVSNLGKFGLDSFTAIINSPESAILAVGAVIKTPVVVNDEITIRPMMSLTLTYDHCVTDGAPAAEFLACIKNLIEEPLLLL